jgi:hypothetical protein
MQAPCPRQVNAQRVGLIAKARTLIIAQLKPLISATMSSQARAHPDEASAEHHEAAIVGAKSADRKHS